MKLKLKLVLGISALLIIFASVLYILVTVRISDLVNDTFLKNAESDAKLGYAYLDSKCPGDWEIRGEKLYKGDICLNGNTEIIDKIKNETGNLTTIFMNDTRVATAVLLDDGSRATGTRASEEVISKVLVNGQNFSGQAVVAKKPALAFYMPLKDSKGKIIGMWFTGMEKSNADRHLDTTLLYIGISILIMLMLGFIDSYFIGSRITSAVGGIRNHLVKLSQGDFSKEIADRFTRRGDEVGEAAKALLNMQTEIKEILNAVIYEAKHIDELLDDSVSNMDKLNAGLDEISSTTEELSAGMEQTAASMQEMNAASSGIGTAVEGIAATARKNLETVKEINGRANSMKANARISRDNANLIYEDSQNKLKSAIEQSKAITQIEVLSDTIMQITSRTNLLSLNATIEAARAGEAGKSFSVVAEEIRKLAVESRNAVGEIQSIIKNVLYSIENLTDSSKNILDFIDRQVVKDYETLVHTGDGYSSDADSILELINGFKTTSETLLASIGNMLKAIGEVAVTTNQGANGTSNIAQKAAAIAGQGNEVFKLSEETKACSGRLKKYISKFILE